MEEIPVRNGLHHRLEGDKLIRTKRKAIELQAELNCLYRALGHGAVTVVCDPKTGVILDSSFTSIEFRQLSFCLFIHDFHRFFDVERINFVSF